MTEPDQCIICLESLQPPLSTLSQPDSAAPITPTAIEAPATATATATATTKTVFQRIDSDIEILQPEDQNNLIATLVGCNHIVHDRCIRSWAKNSNTCPICRTPFNEVRLSSELNGPAVDSYAVQDKKQQQEFDIHTWLAENPDEDAEPPRVCPVCDSGDQEDVLLLCDGCNAAYHTHCIGLSGVPQTESWYCFECPSSPSRGNVFRPNTQGRRTVSQAARRNAPARRSYLRTQLQARNARREARYWEGAWDQITRSIFDATEIDLDNHEEDDAFQSFRRAQSQREQMRAHRDWEQRMNIASRAGARDVFFQSIGHRLGNMSPQQDSPTPAPATPEMREEQRAWETLAQVRQTETTAAAREAQTTSNSRKRKAKSSTSSPQEPAEEPERKLKRPRTRRLPLHGEAFGSVSASASTSASASAAAPSSASASAATPASASASSPAPMNIQTSGSHNNAAARRPESPNVAGTGPSFLSSLLKEVEMSTPSDDETVRNYFGTRSGVDPSSPVTSPSPSSRNSPRALSLTPPPHTRPVSPTTLSLSSYIEPRFPKANYSPTRASGDSSDSDSRSNGAEIRQPRPQRPMRHRANLPRSQDSSPTRPAISLETKEKICNIVRAALHPHYQAKELTSDQFMSINRDISRKLYEGLRDPVALDEDGRKAWQKIAAKEVARAIEELKA
ncbi:PHD-finger domain-containing protein [Colletotrichum plurivorum]|uniref:PHD-finger domain-containing protein n=1 Tax=Colletotrichum plurivorum TaxID=2175906 RepID=A0A8H6NMX7_9PEZI|nr:PHD-finger domain-containing protein [Colletotrichum plurivorum]